MDNVPMYIKQILTDLKREIDINAIIIEDSNTPTFINA